MDLKMGEEVYHCPWNSSLDDFLLLDALHLDTLKDEPNLIKDPLNSLRKYGSNVEEIRDYFIEHFQECFPCKTRYEFLIDYAENHQKYYKKVNWLFSQ